MGQCDEGGQSQDSLSLGPRMSYILHLVSSYYCTLIALQPEYCHVDISEFVTVLLITSDRVFGFSVVMASINQH